MAGIHRRWLSAKESSSYIEGHSCYCIVCNTDECGWLGGNGIVCGKLSGLSTQIYWVKKRNTISWHNQTCNGDDITGDHTAALWKMAGLIKSEWRGTTEEDHPYRW